MKIPRMLASTRRRIFPSRSSRTAVACLAAVTSISTNKFKVARPVFARPSARDLHWDRIDDKPQAIFGCT